MHFSTLIRRLPDECFKFVGAWKAMPRHRWCSQHYDPMDAAEIAEATLNRPDGPTAITDDDTDKVAYVAVPPLLFLRWLERYPGLLSEQADHESDREDREDRERDGADDVDRDRRDIQPRGH